MPFELFSELPKLCTWLYSDDENAGQPTDFTAMIDLSMIEKANRNFQNAARVKSFTQHSLPDAANSTVETADHNSFYFLNFCRTYLQDNEQNPVQLPLCFLVLNYLIQPNLKLDVPAKPAKVAALFAQLINLDENKALDLYHNHPTFVKQRPLQARVAVVSRKLKNLEAILLHEKNLLGIIPLFVQKIDDCDAFAALILYVLKNGVTADELIDKKTLSIFLAYHLHSLSDEDNAVNTLYAVLDRLEEVKQDSTKLAKKAKTSPAKIQRLESSLSLTGEIIGKKSKGDGTLDPFAFTVTEDNFKNLHSLFGNRFLYEALKFSAANPNNDLRGLLHSCFNDQENHDLSRLSNLVKILKETTPHLLEQLAKIIDDATINKFIDQKNGLIFHLASYKPLIIDRLINTDDFKKYIKELIQSNGNRHDTLTQLVPLFKNANRYDIQRFLYCEILKLMIGTTEEDPIEDESVIDTIWMPRSLDYKAIITQLANELMVQLKQPIASLKNDLSRNAYLNVEDTWRVVAKKFNLLKRLTNFNFPGFPTDKYALYALVVYRLLKADIIDFNLKDFLQNILLMQNEFSEGDIGISEFERGLIEILTSVDDPRVRTAAIELFDTTPRKNEQWIKQKYDGKSVFSLAARKNNIGLHKFLLTTKIVDNISSADLSHALVSAAGANQWDVVGFLCTLKASNKPFYNATSYALKKAVSANQWAIVKKLLAMKGYSMPTAEAVFFALAEAARDSQWEVVSAICAIQADNKDRFYSASCLNPDSRDKQFYTLKRAAIAGQLEVVPHLLEMAVYNGLDTLRALSEALKEKASANKWGAVLDLCAMLANKPDNVAISEALKQKAFEEAAAANQWQIVLAICSMQTCNKPNSAVIFSDTLKQKALKKAVAANQWQVVLDLCAMQARNKQDHTVTSDALTQEALKEAVAANRWDIVLTVCSMQTDNKPGSDAASYALEAAVSANQLAIVEKLLAMKAKPSARAVYSALGAAAEHNQFEIVSALCTMLVDNKPDDAVATYHALNKAAKAGHLKVVQLLLAIQDNNGFDFPAGISEALKEAATANKWEVVLALCNLETVNRPSDDAVAVALMTATNQGLLNIVQELFKSKNPPNKYAVAEALKEAVKPPSSLPSTVKVLCELADEKNLLDKGAVEAVLLEAVNLNQSANAQVLCELKTNSQPDSKVVLEAMELAVTTNKWSIVQMLCKLTTENKPTSREIGNLANKYSWNVEWHYQFKQIEKILILHESISKLEQYGQDLIDNEGRKDDGNTAKNFASELKSLANSYIDSTFSSWMPLYNVPESIKSEFTKIFLKGKKEMGIHCPKLSRIWKNIAIAATRIRLFAVIGKLLIAGAGFFSNTERQKRLCTIEEAYNELLQPK
jgi:hypothetical protein